MPKTKERLGICIKNQICFSDCTCNADGSEDEVCLDSGKCFCKDNFAGDTCSECTDGYYGTLCEGNLTGHIIAF